MLNKVKKIFIILLSIMFIFSLFYMSFAGDNFDINAFEGKEAPDQVTTLTKDVIGAIVSVLRIAASGILIIMLVVISIRYMTSSAGDRADIKKHAVAFVIAALILFGSSVIIEVLVELAGMIVKKEG